MILPRIFLLIIVCLLSSCVNSTNEINQFYKPFSGIPQKRVNPAIIRIIDVPYKPDKKLALSITSQGYLCLGTASFTGPQATPLQLQQFASSVGGDLLFYEKKFVRKERGSRMVLGSYTPPTIGYSTATASGYASGNQYANATTPWGPVSVDSYSQASSYDEASATTYNPGQSTYVRQDFEYDFFEQGVIVWQSPQGQVKNWANIEKAIGSADNIFNLQEFLNTYKSNYKSLSPQRKALADAIESGQKFTQTTACQFLFNQFMINEQKKSILKNL